MTEYKNDQVLITESLPLLQSNGALTKAGYATTDLWQYNKECIVGKSRLKEWEFYQVSNENFLMQITYGHVTYAGNVGFTLVEFETGHRYTTGIMKFFPNGKFDLNFTSGQPHSINYQSKSISVKIENSQGKRSIALNTMDENCVSEVHLFMPEDGDAMCYVMPFYGKKFYYNYKKMFSKVSGSILVNGKNYAIDERTNCLVDSGRGCWPYRHQWIWGMAQGYVGQDLVAFDIGYGNSDRGDTTENMLFVNGVAHKLGHITAHYNKNCYNEPWKFTSDNGRFEMDFVPFFDNFTETNYIIVHNRCHQVFGHYYGKAILDDGKEIFLHSINGFCEHSINRW